MQTQGKRVRVRKKNEKWFLFILMRGIYFIVYFVWITNINRILFVDNVYACQRMSYANALEKKIE